MHENQIESISELGLRHIKGFLKQMSKDWLNSYSNYRRQNDITALKQFQILIQGREDKRR